MEKPPQKRTKKSEMLPKYDSFWRNAAIFVMLTASTNYQKTLKTGLPFFKIEELEELESKYEDGMTWEDINRELSHKGLILKKATFRKYIQDGHLPKAIDYKKTPRGRMALFPAQTIKHINFLQYCFRVADDKELNALIEAVYKAEREISYFDAINQNTDGGVLYAGMLDCIAFGDDREDIIQAIENTLHKYPEDRDNVISRLDKIADKFESEIRPEIDDLVKTLKSKTLMVSDLLGSNEEAYE